MEAIVMFLAVIIGLDPASTSQRSRWGADSRDSLQDDHRR